MEQHTAHRGKKEVSEDVRCLRCTVSETLTAGEFYRGSEPAQQSVSLPSPADTHYSRDCMLAYTRRRDVAVDGNARSILIVPVESDGV